MLDRDDSLSPSRRTRGIEAVISGRAMTRSGSRATTSSVVNTRSVAAPRPPRSKMSALVREEVPARAGDDAAGFDRTSAVQHEDVYEIKWSFILQVLRL